MVTHWNPKQRLRERERETRLSHCLDVISSTLEGSSCRAHAEKTKIEGSFEGLQKNDERHNECFASFVLIALENPHMFITIKDNDLKAAMAALPIIIAYYQQCDWWIFNVCCVGAKLAICWQHIFILLTLSLLQLSGVWNECSFYCLHNHWFSKSALLSFGWECKTRVGANRTFFTKMIEGNVEAIRSFWEITLCGFRGWNIREQSNYHHQLEGCWEWCKLGNGGGLWACMHYTKKIKMPEALMSCCQIFRSGLKWSMLQPVMPSGLKELTYSFNYLCQEKGFEIIQSRVLPPSFDF